MSQDPFMNKFHETRNLDPMNPIAGLQFVFAKWIQEKQDQTREMFWITVNPKPEIPFEEFKEKVLKKLMNRTIMQGAAFCFEQRAGAKPYSGFHCHILVDKRMSPKQMHDRVFNTVKDIVGTTKHVDLRTYPYTMRQDKLDYMQGKKWDDEKEDAISATEAWRKEIKLPTMFWA